MAWYKCDVPCLMADCVPSPCCHWYRRHTSPGPHCAALSGARGLNSSHISVPASEKRLPHW